ncbi:MAG: DUF4150 domain-containing protein [Geminicoccaceae bacterium]
MANDVFANGREISCKSGAGKSICAFPDVCFTPPENPATPPGVPIPYPNTGMASDTTSGSKKVKITKKEAMLKNKSYFKKSMGDEAGCAAKKGIITSTNRGKVYFVTWSMDVKFEGENVVRHLDMTTHNHASPVGNESIPWPQIDTQALPETSKCHGDKKKKDDACDGKDPCPGVLKRKPGNLKKQVARSPTKRAADVAALDATKKGKESRTSKAAKVATQEANNSDCVRASRCHLRPYKPKKGQPACCPGQTPHHIPPKTCFKGVKKYKKDKALCVCLEGTSQHAGSHGKNHAIIDHLAKKNDIDPGEKCSIADYNKICAQAVAIQCDCDPDCIEQQLNESLKPTNRKIKHWESKSKQLDDKAKEEIDEAYEALSAPSIG